MRGEFCKWRYHRHESRNQDWSSAAVRRPKKSRRKICAILIFPFSLRPQDVENSGWKYERNEREMKNRDPFSGVVELKAEEKKTKKPIFFSFAHAAENFLFLKFLWLKFEGIKQPWHGEVKWDGRDGTWWILWLRNYWFVWNTLRMFRGILNFFLAGTHICK